MDVRHRHAGTASPPPPDQADNPTALHGAEQPSASSPLPSTSQPRAKQPAVGFGLATFAKLAAVAILLATIALTLKRRLSDPVFLQSILDTARGRPATVIPGFMAANIAAPLFLFPAAPFLLLAGAVWGIPTGLLISGTATLASNLLAFAIVRHLLRDRIQGYIVRTIPSFPTIQAAIQAEGWRLVLMLRLSPILPDSLMNYILSLVVTFDVYAAATAVATVPWALLYLYLGSASKDIVSTLSGASAPPSEGSTGGSSWVNVAVMAVSGVMVVGAVVYMSRIIRQAMAKAAQAAADGGEKPQLRTEG